MSTLQEKGREIKRSYELDKEIEICEMFDLTRVTTGKSRRKADAESLERNEFWSIKNARNSSTQVYLTTLKKLRERFNIPEGGIDLFLGDKQKNRLNLDEIPSALVNETLEWLETHKHELIKFVISGEESITHVCFRDLNNGKVYVLSPSEILSKVADSEWRVGARKGSFQLVHNGKVIFHLQREGKGKSPNNPLFHIHRNCFIGG